MKPGCTLFFLLCSALTVTTTAHAQTDGLLNPGKNIPTLHRCAEFGAMHVHHGHLPFPELERF